MTPDDLRTLVITALTDVAPEVDAGSLRDDVPFNDQLDLDSMDFLEFVAGMSERAGVDIPETAYADVSTLDGCVAYLGANVA